MELKPALKKLEESREFKKWRQKNKSTYFSYAFKILQEMDPDEWQIGFYIKTIAILQNIKELGNIWNITYVTEAFNTLNMRIDASTGKVLEHKLSSVFSFRKE